VPAELSSQDRPHTKFSPRSAQNEHVGWLVSMFTTEKRAQELFEDEKLRLHLGIGAE
jgi:hypothetical protein